MTDSTKDDYEDTTETQGDSDAAATKRKPSKNTVKPRQSKAAAKPTPDADEESFDDVASDEGDFDYGDDEADTDYELENGESEPARFSETGSGRPRRREPRTGSGPSRPSRPAQPGYSQAGPSNRRGSALLAALLGLGLVLALVAAVVFGVLWNMKRSELSDIKAAEADRAQAEKVAGEYAAGASTFDYKDLGPWSGRLTNGVSPELKTKMDATASAMNQLLQPLQWVSKGTTMDTVVNSQSGPIYKVSAYVTVDATNVQAPSGRSVVTVYNVTMNKDSNWQITDVGGAVQPGGPLPTTGDGAQPAPQTPAPAPAPTETGAPAPAPAPAPGG